MLKLSISRARLEENSHLLQPPINNYCVYNEGFTVMVGHSTSLQNFGPYAR